MNTQEPKTQLELATIYVDTFVQSNPELLRPYLSPSFTYKSSWGGQEFDDPEEYLVSLDRTMKAVAKQNMNYTYCLGIDERTEQYGMMMDTHDGLFFLSVESEGGLITRAELDTPMRWQRKYSKADELYQTHGDHIDCIMDAEEFIREHLRGIIKDSGSYRRCITRVTAYELYSNLALVNSLLYGEGEMRLETLIAYNHKSRTNSFISIYPVLAGKVYEATVDEVLEWSNHIEATIYVTIGESQFAFFATDYCYNKKKYVVGEKITISLAALGNKVSEASRGFEFTGQQAIDFLAKTGQEPEYDEDGNVEPVKFSTEQLVAFLNTNEKCPDEATFQSPATNIGSSSLMGIDFYKCNILIIDKDGRYEVPLYFRRDQITDIVDDTPIMGYLWLTGRIVGEEARSERDSYLADKIRAYQEAVAEMAFHKFNNLDCIANLLPFIIIKEGYKLDGFKCGDKDHANVFQLYVCKRDSQVRWEPQIVTKKKGLFRREEVEVVTPPYDDSMFIHNYLGRKESEEVPSPLSYFDVPFTEDGIMDAWLLQNSSYFMPRFWHAAYGGRDFVTSLNQLSDDKVADDVVANEELLPNLAINGTTALFSYCYWSPWSGLHKVEEQVSPSGNSVVFETLQDEIIVPYNCGIVL